jgi:signal transduction histidine kinase
MGALLVRLAFKPVEHAVVELDRRGPLDLRDLKHGPMPVEFEPMLGAINRLMARVGVAMRSERNFVSAAAHELRTPLAGVRAQAQLAVHPRASIQERQAALLSVLEGIDHATYLVNQLLDLARSDMLAGDPSRIARERESVALDPLCRSILAELVEESNARHVQLRTYLEVGHIDGSAFGIGLIVRNLVANAIAHTPHGGDVGLGTFRDVDGIVLWVDDSGPGLPASERARVFERFHRGPGATRPGCGLGLSIVKAIADAHGARVTLGDSLLGGLAARVTFPAT